MAKKTPRPSHIRRKIVPTKKRSRVNRAKVRLPESGTTSNYMEKKRLRNEEAARRKDPRLQKSRGNAAIFLGLAVVVQMIVVTGQFNHMFERGWAGRFALAVQFSVAVLLVLCTALGFTVFRLRVFWPVLLAALLYLAYVPLAILLDEETGTFALLLMAVAMLALLRSLASGFMNRKAFGLVYGGLEETEKDE